MKLRKAAIVAVLASSAIGIAAGTANAAPAVAAPVPTDPQQFVANAAAVFNGVVNPASVPAGQPAPVLDTPLGSISVQGGRLQVGAPDGSVIAAAPAPATPAAVAANPDLVDDVAARPVPVTPVLDYGWKTEGDREQWAFKRAQDSVSLAASIAGATGAAGGGLIGCGIGGAVGAVGGGVALPVFGLPMGALAGCLVGATTGAALGGLVTAAAVTLPVAVAAGIGYYQTISSPFVPPKSSPQKVEIVNSN
ncbi:hypothetical protein [Skermania piniformis]|uniref:Uncharacterized protein n=1 Tax=Skermania pinensis TaxID=39122 RepID=A0ABX8SAQ4_9ACTN|nr:hypothetical protein [Skermania piniformis]QXQ14074.1 hypothetical protein KV203_01000 [Skermania piniformis]